MARNADPPQAQPELPPFQRFPDDYNPDNSDPLDRAIEWFMTLDPETNSRLETVFTLIVLAITVISAKETYEKWLREKTEEDNLRKQKIRRALNPDGWREELFKEEQAEKLKEQQKEQKRGVKDVLEEIYGTDGLEDQFDSRIRPGTRRPPMALLVKVMAHRSGARHRAKCGDGPKCSAPQVCTCMYWML